MSDLLWPHHLLRPTDDAWTPWRAGLSGGQPFSGASAQAVSFDGGPLWRAELIDIALRMPEQINAWHAIEALIGGSTRRIVLPRCDRRFGLFLQGASGPITATALAGAAVRATTVRLGLTNAAPMAAGVHFSIDHGGDLGWRLYRTVAVPSGAPAGSVEIRPPLRAAIVIGQAVEFDLPRCVMRLLDPNSMKLTRQMLKRGRQTVAFLESLA